MREQIVRVEGSCVNKLLLHLAHMPKIIALSENNF
jgi:hypothetical protein